MKDEIVFEAKKVRKSLPQHILWQPVRATVHPVQGLDAEGELRQFSVVEVREWSDGTRTRSSYRFPSLKQACSEASRWVRVEAR